MHGIPGSGGSRAEARVSKARHGRDNFVEAARFIEKGIGPGLDGMLAGVRTRAAEHQDWNVAAGAAQGGKDLEAIEAGEVPVKDDEIEGVRQGDLQSVVAAFMEMDVIASAAQGSSIEHAQRRVVFDHEDVEYK